MDSLRNLLALLGVVIAFALVMGAVHFVYQRFQRKAPHPLTDADIERVAREGDVITAIRWHRELHGSRLTEAKQAVEGMVAQAATPQSQE